VEICAGAPDMIRSSRGDGSRPVRDEIMMTLYPPEKMLAELTSAGLQEVDIATAGTRFFKPVSLEARCDSAEKMLIA